MVRTLIAALTASIAGGAAIAQPGARAIENLAGDVYRFQDGGHFGVFMVTPEGVILADPINPEVAEWVKGEIAERFDAEVTHVLYSHHHWDHAAGAAVFDNATVVAHAAATTSLAPKADDAPLTSGAASDDAAGNGDDRLQRDEATGIYAQRFDDFDTNGDGELTAAEMFAVQYADVKLPDETYDSERHTLELGGKTVELHHVDANHASDMSYIYFPEEKVLFVVDVISAGSLPYLNLPDYDHADMHATIDAAMAFEGAIFAGGHGVVGDLSDVEAFRQYHIDLHDGVKAGIDAGQSLEEIQASLMLEAYSDWGAYGFWREANIAGMHRFLTSGS